MLLLKEDLEENDVTKLEFIDDQQRQDDLIESISGDKSIRGAYTDKPFIYKGFMTKVA